MSEKKKKYDLIAILRNLPEIEPPQELTPLVMARILPKKLSFWSRIWSMARTPKVIKVTPYKMATVVMVVVVMLGVVFQYSTENTKTVIAEADAITVPVAFALYSKDAMSVNLIGSFNGWKPEGYAMQLDKKRNRWVIDINIPPGRYEYSFLINHNQAVPDPNATIYKDDGFDSHNSLIFISSNDERAL